MPESEIMGARRDPRDRPAWPKELLDRALALSASGLSASEVGALIGKSRDAVLGQVWRAKNPPAVRPARVYVPRKPRSTSGKGAAHPAVWSAWDQDEETLRRAIWARARRGARKTLEAT